MGTTTNQLDEIIKAGKDAHPLMVATELLRRRFLALATQKLRRERNETGKRTPSDLINEAIARMLQTGNQRFDGAGHFLGAVATAMERILIDDARRRKRRPTSFSISAVLGTLGSKHEQRADIDELVEALQWLGEHFPQDAEVLRMRYYLGMKNRTIADVLKLSEEQVKGISRRGMAMVRQYLKTKDGGGASGHAGGGAPGGARG